MKASMPERVLLVLSRSKNEKTYSQIKKALRVNDPGEMNKLGSACTRLALSKKVSRRKNRDGVYVYRKRKTA